jgi:hypothetical protein
VSGSRVVDFGGTIQTISNAIHGISINSKGGLDLDAGSQVTSAFNLGDGVHLEQNSELTIFNNPAFSQVSTASLLTASYNQTNGINLLSGSKLLDDNHSGQRSQQLYRDEPDRHPAHFRIAHLPHRQRFILDFLLRRHGAGTRSGRPHLPPIAEGR